MKKISKILAFFVLLVLPLLNFGQDEKLTDKQIKELRDSAFQLRKLILLFNSIPTPKGDTTLALNFFSDLTYQDIKLINVHRQLVATLIEEDGDVVRNQESADICMSDFLTNLANHGYSIDPALTPENRRLTRGISFDYTTFSTWLGNMYADYDVKRVTLKFGQYNDNFIDKQFPTASTTVRNNIKSKKSSRFTVFVCACENDGKTQAPARDGSSNKAPLLNLGGLYP